MSTPLPTPTEPEIKLQFEMAEQSFERAEKAIKLLREFLVKWRKQIEPYTFNCIVQSSGLAILCFSCRHTQQDQAKNIARGFGATDWTRERDIVTCGLINWRKTIDGVRIDIDGAENLENKLIKEVKL